MIPEVKLLKDLRVLSNKLDVINLLYLNVNDRLIDQNLNSVNDVTERLIEVNELIVSLLPIVKELRSKCEHVTEDLSYRSNQELHECTKCKEIFKSENNNRHKKQLNRD